jgi:hypothetical protein
MRHEEYEMAGDAIQVAPHVYKVDLENDKVRVLDTRTELGGTSDMHSNPIMVGCAISDCTWDLTDPNGETFYLDAVDHAAKDVGTSGSHALLIELK